MSNDYPTKRGYVEEEEEPVTNDLEVAATYAMAQYVVQSAATTPPSAMIDENEINVDDEEEEDQDVTELPVSEKTENEAMEEEKKQDGDPSPPTMNNNDDDDDDDESDVESEIDLTEALQQMDKDHDDVDEEDEENEEDNPVDDLRGNGNSTTSNVAPQTANEVDGYYGSVEQVEQVFGTSLQVDAALVTPQHTHPAGHIQHFMVEERILVVRSLGNSPLLLEEGNLLVLKEPSWIPLGKILEVFGPVSQPLYSIRLPEPADDGESDPWSPMGRHTQWIRQHKDALVHYLPQQAKLVDTHRLLAQQRRGCDASNIHDEEAGEIDFSDDEMERQARGRRRGSASQRTRPAAPAPAVATTTPGGFFVPVPLASTVVVAPPQPPAPPPQEESDTIYYD